MVVECVVIGSGDLGKKVVRHLEENTPYRPSLIIGRESGRSMDGIPVIEMDLEKIKGKPVFIADKELGADEKEKIKSAASEVTDFTGTLSNNSGYLPVSTLLSLSSGPVVLIVDGAEKKYGSGREALESLKDRYSVKKIEVPIWSTSNTSLFYLTCR